MNVLRSRFLLIGILLLCVPARLTAAEPSPMKLAWEKNVLTISGEHLPGKEIKIWYLEAYCGPGSTDRDWGKTVIPHKTELVSARDDGRQLKLKCSVSDGVMVEHTITATHDEIDFRLIATNPTDKPSEIHWAEPCLRVDKFTGRDQKTYLEKCFVFLDGKLERFPTRDWATQARYTPGQVWAAKGGNRNTIRHMICAGWLSHNAPRIGMAFAPPPIRRFRSARLAGGGCGSEEA